MKLAIYAICKNEAKHIERWYNSVKEADGIFVTDTGSVDSSVLMMESLGITVNSVNVTPFRFDTARNASLNFVPEEYDYAMFIDMDEVLEDGAIAKIKAEIERSSQSAYYTNLIFSRQEDGTPGITYKRLCVHKRKFFYWRYPAHEVLESHLPSNDVTYGDIPVSVEHLQDTAKDRTFYLNLLRLGYEENPNDPRCVLYYARELMYAGAMSQALTMFTYHLSIEPNAELRCQSAMYAAECCGGDLISTESYLLRACSEFNFARDPFCRLAELYLSHGMTGAAYGILNRADGVEDRTSLLIKDERYYGNWFLHVYAATAYNSGNGDEAKRIMLRLLESDPGTLQGSLLTDVLVIFKDHIVDGQLDLSGFKNEES
jgi:glycosyltransferase involved in cell wall biosynthesis